MKNRPARFAAVLLALVVSALTFSACEGEVSVGGDTTIEASDLEGQLASKFAPKLDQEADQVSVDCPDDQSAEKGTKFLCTLTKQNDGEVEIEVTLTDDEGSYDAVVVADRGK